MARSAQEHGTRCTIKTKFKFFLRILSETILKTLNLNKFLKYSIGRVMTTKRSLKWSETSMREVGVFFSRQARHYLRRQFRFFKGCCSNAPSSFPCHRVLQFSKDIRQRLIFFRFMASILTSITFLNLEQKSSPYDHELPHKYTLNPYDWTSNF